MSLHFCRNLEELSCHYANLKNEASISTMPGAYRPVFEKSIAQISDYVSERVKAGKRLVIFAIDSLSMRAFMDLFPGYLPRGSDVGVLTSVFPSTTNVAWTTMLSGLRPETHGMVAVSFYVEGIGGSYIWLNDTVSHIRAGREAFVGGQVDVFRHVPQNVFETVPGRHTYYGRHGSKVGGKGITLVHERLASGATIFMPGIFGNDYLELEKLRIDVERHVSRNLTGGDCSPGIDWVYVDLDVYVHQYGYSKEIVSELFKPIFDLSDLLRQEGKEVLFCSDHGQTRQGIISRDIFKLSANNDDLEVMTSGAGRTLFFYPKPGKTDTVFRWVKDLIGSTGVVLSKEECVGFGLLGPVEAVSSRVGPIVAIATGEGFPSTGIDSQFEHGGMSEDEMFVPLIRLGSTSTNG